MLWKSRKQRTAELLNRAHQLAASHCHQDALDVLTRCLAHDGGHVPALLTIIQIQAHLGRYDDALNASLRVLDIEPDNRPVLASIGQLLSNPGLTGRYPDIFHFFRGHLSDRAGAGPAADAFAQLAPVLVFRARQMLDAGSPADATGVLEQCLSLLPDFAPAQLALAQVLAYQRMDREALALCIRVINADPANQAVMTILQPLLQRAETAASVEGADTLLAAISRYVSVRRDATPALAPLMSLVDLLSGRKEHRMALDAVRLALQIAPDSQAVHDGFFRVISDPGLSDDASAYASAILPDLMAAHSVLFRPTADERETYDRLATLHVIETLAHVIRRFHHDLETSPDVPLARFLAEARRRLENGRDLEPSSRWALLRFEMAWKLFLEGETDRSTPLFRTILDDPALQLFARHDPFAKEAFVRSGEILGRCEERAGRTDAAMSIYRRTLQLEENAVVAGRMVLLHWRQGNIEAAMTAAESGIRTKLNLFPGLPDGPHMTWLREELRRQEKEPETEERQ